ncbi:MAG: hypothetical protein P1V97_00635, partial [Planctomycetota bacterium]|nr:hypothetical protein [Planctomycetota bacterium]
ECESKPFSLLWFLIWTAVWLTPFGVFMLVLVPAGYGLFGTSWPSGLFYLTATALGLAAYRSELRLYHDRAPNPWSGLAVLGTLLFVLGAWFFAASVWPVSAEIWQEYEKLQMGLIRMDGVYYAAKLPELIFQQSLIFVLVCRFNAMGHRGWRLIRSFAILFALIHCPLIIMKGLAGLPYVLAAAGSALVFPPLITQFRWGIVYSFCAHWGSYAVAGLILRYLAF